MSETISKVLVQVGAINIPTLKVTIYTWDQYVANYNACPWDWSGKPQEVGARILVDGYYSEKGGDIGWHDVVIAN